MKLATSYILLPALCFLFASCNGKKFTASAEERAQYENAFNKLANIQKTIANKEIEPGARQLLLNTADKILMFGNVDQLEENVSYSDFRVALQKAILVTKKMSTDSVDENSAEFKIAEKSYYELQKKLKEMSPHLLKSSMDALPNGSLEADAIPFLVDQVKKYDFNTFLKKTIVPVSEIENTVKSIGQLIAQSDLNIQIDKLNELIEKAQK